MFSLVDARELGGRLGPLHLSSALYLASMFRDCAALTSLDVSAWDVSGAIDCSHMFDGCTSLDPADIPSWDAPTKVDKGGKFEDASEGESEKPSMEPVPDEGLADEPAALDEDFADAPAALGEGIADEFATLSEDSVGEPEATDESDPAPVVFELGEDPASALAA